jgi:hypothetical protein
MHDSFGHENSQVVCTDQNWNTTCKYIKDSCLKSKELELRGTATNKLTLSWKRGKSIGLTEQSAVAWATFATAWTR